MKPLQDDVGKHVEGEVPRIESSSRFWRSLDLDADPSSVFVAL
jgi:hypothetical protein